MNGRPRLAALEASVPRDRQNSTESSSSEQGILHATNPIFNNARSDRGGAVVLTAVPAGGGYRNRAVRHATQRGSPSRNLQQTDDVRFSRTRFTWKSRYVGRQRPTSP